MLREVGSMASVVVTGAMLNCARSEVLLKVGKCGARVYMIDASLLRLCGNEESLNLK